MSNKLLGRALVQAGSVLITIGRLVHAALHWTQHIAAVRRLLAEQTIVCLSSDIRKF